MVFNIAIQSLRGRQKWPGMLEAFWFTWSVTDGVSKFLQLGAWRRKSCLGEQWLQEPELRVDKTRQNVPSQEVTVNLSAFIKEKPNTRALTSEIRSLPCFMPSMYSWKVHVNQMHANQSTFPRDFHFHFRAALSLFLIDVQWTVVSTMQP